MNSVSATYNVYSLSAAGGLSVESASLVGQEVEISNTSGTLDAQGTLTALGFDGPFDGGYSFVSRAVGSGGADGFIAKDSHGHDFFFTGGVLTGGSQSLSLEAGPVTICFLEGTLIDTLHGEVPVESLGAGDHVVKADGGTARVRWIGRQRIARAFASRAQLPICLSADALADGVPSRDLQVSASHALRIGEVLVQAGCLVNGTTITRAERVPQHFTYYHIETEDHCLVVANGAAAETFIDNVDREQFDNWNEREGSWPDDEPLVELDLPRVKAVRQLPVALRDNLERRARMLWASRARAAA